MAKSILTSLDLQSLTALDTPRSGSINFAAKADGLYYKIGTTEYKIENTGHTHSYSFAQITGTATAAQIPSLDSSKITTGILAISRIPTGTTSTTVALGNHLHTGVYEPAFTKNTAFNKSFGTISGTVAEGNHTHNYLPLAGGIITGDTTFNTNIIAKNGVKYFTDQGTVFDTIALKNNTSIPNGYIKFVTPIKTAINQMFSIDIVGYDYYAGKSIDFTVVGYAYSASDAVINVGFSNRSSFNRQVRIVLEDRGLGYRQMVIALGADDGSGTSSQTWYFQKFSATVRLWGGGAAIYNTSDFSWVNGETTLSAGYWQSSNINNQWLDGQVGSINTSGTVTASSFTGALLGNADTATKLQNSRTIWGQSFDGSGNITGALTSGDKIISGTGKGFRSAGYQTGFNPIWAFNNAETYGLGYYQGAHGLVGVTGDAIGFHFGSTTAPKVIVDSAGKIIASTFIGALTGNADTATKLQTARTLTIGNTGKTFDGTANVVWSLAEMGVLPLTGGTLTGALAINLGASANYPLNLTSAGVTTNIGSLNSTWCHFNTTATTGFYFYKNIQTPLDVTARNFIGALSGNASTATKLATARTINGTSFDGSANITTANWGTARTLSFTGDVTGSSSVNGSANVATAMTLANSGVTAGTYRSVTVDAKGRVTAGTNPTTLSGYGITDAAPKSHSDISGESTIHHTHSNKTNLNTINQAMATTNAVTFASLTALTEVRTNKVNFGNSWTLEPSGTELQLKFAGATKMRFLSDGSIVATGEVTAFGATV